MEKARCSIDACCHRRKTTRFDFRCRLRVNCTVVILCRRLDKEIARHSRQTRLERRLSEFRALAKPTYSHVKSESAAIGCQPFCSRNRVAIFWSVTKSKFREVFIQPRRPANCRILPRDETSSWLMASAFFKSCHTRASAACVLLVPVNKPPGLISRLLPSNDGDLDSPENALV